VVEADALGQDSLGRGIGVQALGHLQRLYWEFLGGIESVVRELLALDEEAASWSS